TLPVALWGPAPRSAFVGEVLFLQNYIGGVWWHTWSLAVEEHFYLLLAGATWLLAKAHPSQAFRAIPALSLIVAVTCLGLRIATPHTNFPQLINPTHLRIDSLMFGVLLSYGWHFGRLKEQARRWRGLLGVAGVVLLAPAFVFPLQATWWVPVY